MRRVLAAFLPDEITEWTDDEGYEWKFYRFLVVCDGPVEPLIGLPYWHTKQNEKISKTPYGQFAPSIGKAQFNELISKARAAGYIASRSNPVSRLHHNTALS